MARRAAIGIIGCGNISETYLRLANGFGNVEIVAVADIVPAAAKARAEQFSVRAMTVDGLLKDDGIDAVVNLTVPDVHYSVTKSILSAGKHAYTEKPLALNARDANKLVADADKRGLKLGSAPDTFLGAGAQTARRLLDKGTIGRVIGGTAYVMSRGMEHWHPNPSFFFQPGAGPIFDVGVYYITTLVSLLGEVKRVAAMASKGFGERIVTAAGPQKGRRIKVTTPTNINAILTFADGAQVTLGASWDVWRHGHQNPIELYGADGSMLVPDPNFFAGRIAYSDKGGDYTEVDTGDGPFGAANWPWSGPFTRANYRMLGVADLIDAAAKNREPRCSGRLAAHVVDVMEAILTSAAEKSFVKVKSTVDRPAPLTPADAKRLAAKTSVAAAA
jgi:predicted dehydrogenase